MVGNETFKGRSRSGIDENGGNNGNDHGRSVTGSLKSVYQELIMDKISRSNISGGHEDGVQEMGNGTTIDRGMILHDSYVDDVNDTEYNNFKEKLLSKDRSFGYVDNEDDDWLNDLRRDEEEEKEEDEMFTDEADESFIEIDENDEPEERDDDSGYYYDDENDEDDNGTIEYTSEHTIIDKSSNHFTVKRLLSGLIAFLLLWVYLSNTKSTPHNLPSGNVQKQINHLYNVVNKQNDKFQEEFDKTIKIVITQFEKKIKTLLPKNLLEFQSQFELLNSKVNKLNQSQKNGTFDNNNSQFANWNLTMLQENLIDQLNENLPDRIPVVIDNNTSILVIPEFYNHVKNILSNVISNIENVNNITKQQHLEPDLNEYIKEILNNEFQYIDKAYFTQEINRKLQLNKHEIFNEISDKINSLEAKGAENQGVQPEDFSTILLKKMIHKIYNANHYQWEDDLDFATFAQGTRLLNHLTSATWKKGSQNSPLELLSNTNTINNSVYWQCQSNKNCTWAIRFFEPIYLFRISYVHGRLTNNVHIMNSAPKKMSIYVKLANNKSLIKKFQKVAETYKQGQLLEKDTSYIKIGQYDYSLADPMIKQDFLLPSWFIKLRPLVHSIVFQVDENYGNKQFTSLRKFIIKAVTKQDLQITTDNEFPLKFGDIPEFGSMNFLEEFEGNHLNHPKRTNRYQNQNQNQNQGNGFEYGEMKYEHINQEGNSQIPSFGQDELDI